MRKSQENDSSAAKTQNRNDEKININIFLANNLPDVEFGSDTECVGKQTNQPKSVLKLSENKPKLIQEFIIFFFVHFHALFRRALLTHLHAIRMNPS